MCRETYIKEGERRKRRRVRRKRTMMRRHRKGRTYLLKTFTPRTLTFVY